MEIWENGTKVAIPVNNTIIGDFKETNTKITFKGSGNILCCEDDTRLADCNITFCSDNAVVYLAANRRHWTKVKIDAWRDVSVYVGRNNYFNGVLTAIVSERKNLIIGDNGVFSFGVFMRTADPHLVYSIASGKRLNPSKSILIGDHVWLGQNALILKGTAIGSGSVLAAGAVIAGKKVPSHTVWGGNPARQIQEGIFFTGDSVHNYTAEQTEASMATDDKRYIYQEGKKTVTMKKADSRLAGKSPGERLAILRELAAENTDRNRLFIPMDKPHGLRAVFGK